MGRRKRNPAALGGGPLISPGLPAKVNADGSYAKDQKP